MDEVTVIHAQPGDSLSEIAARNGVTVEQLQRWNGIENPDLVQAGQILVVYSAAEPSVGPAGSLASPAQDAPGGSSAPWLGSIVALALMLLLWRRRATAASRARPGPPASFPQRYGPKPAPVDRPKPAPRENDGERLVQKELMRYYREWTLLNDVLLPAGQGTTQIDHILVSPRGVFLIETKDMNGWIFGSPGRNQWTQSFRAGRWSRMRGVRSRQFRFYNPMLQNEGHARALVNLGIVDWPALRPIVVFVGDAQLKTADRFLQFDEHENRADQFRSWRMRGVVCMGLKDLHRYIAFADLAPSNPRLTPQTMHTISAKIREAAIPLTAESRARHVQFVRSAQRDAHG